LLPLLQLVVRVAVEQEWASTVRVRIEWGGGIWLVHVTVRHGVMVRVHHLDRILENIRIRKKQLREIGCSSGSW
jgi:hypothetical protein